MANPLPTVLLVPTLRIFLYALTVHGLVLQNHVQTAATTRRPPVQPRTPPVARVAK